MVARIVITADDAGALESIDQAILVLLRRGLVSEAAAFPNGPTFSSLAAQTRHDLIPHLTLTYGCPFGALSGLDGLTNERGQFRQPMDFYVGDIDQAIAEWAACCYVPSSERAGAEIRRQLSHFRAITGRESVRATYHHDIDRVIFDLHPEFALPEFYLGRVGVQQAGASAGYLYRFLPRTATELEAERHVLETIEMAIEISSSQGGRPAEAIFHPAADLLTMETFTVYREERLQEYRALQSTRVSSMLLSARRRGALYEFD